jgi:long-subunit acyl-CoA synthetase (AMP-forming)/predicted GNAT family acetyltransferase
MSHAESLSLALQQWDAKCSLENPAIQESLRLAELLLNSPPDPQNLAPLRHYLQSSRLPQFLQGLGDRTTRERWAETAFAAIRQTNYTLESLFHDRVALHPDRDLFRLGSSQSDLAWSYERALRRIRAIAAVFLGDGGGTQRVAIFADNSIDSACCDLACLLHDIFDVPLNVHFDSPTLLHIFNESKISLVITDNEERYDMLCELRSHTDLPLCIYRIGENPRNLASQDVYLPQACSRIGRDLIDSRIICRPRFSLDDTATVLYTSGSTGLPKGVAFTQFNLISKRFARAAALPNVGVDETLLCYLPLFHTFGRYFELLGSIFWGGTYVFAGNPSADTLLSQLKTVCPTGLISVPVRWVQIHDHCQKRMAETSNPEQLRRIFDEATGGNLRWGLSAAGFLEPKVFRFFQRYGVELCSGFGMTEGTGGITMTPPGEYVDGSVGIPLPGMHVRLSEQGEMLISGPYVARYVNDPPAPPSADRWLSTGDLFTEHSDGHLEIVDRVKDIYKNSKGQTIAPRRVEKNYADVPGIKRVFLVGDGRDYNTLLVVPDLDDSVLSSSKTDEALRAYVHQIVTAANKDLATFERVVNFAILDRDLSLDKNELTPKGSVRRKIVEENFIATIRELYRKRYVSLNVQNLEIRIPRWFFRDLGVLETDIVAEGDRLTNRQTQRCLHVAVLSPDQVQLGDFVYTCSSTILDLGLFARSPYLWVSNAQLVAFCPIKDGWDAKLHEVSPRVNLPDRRFALGMPAPELPTSRLASEGPLGNLHKLSISALFGPTPIARDIIEKLGTLLTSGDSRIAAVARRRLEALSRHVDLEVRCKAYRTLLLNVQPPDSDEILPSFIHSGLPFIDESTIEIIGKTTFERRRLDALRQRLAGYRESLSWPASDTTRNVFIDVFKLLENFVHHHPEDYAAVREELAAWSMHDKDPVLSKIAERKLRALASQIESQLDNDPSANLPEGGICYQDGITDRERARIEGVFVETSFLAQSIMLAFDEPAFDVSTIDRDGVWISRYESLEPTNAYRVSVNTTTGKHYDLSLVIPADFNTKQVRQTIYWIMAISAWPYGTSVLSRFGCYRPELGAYSTASAVDLTVWDKIREFASLRIPNADYPAQGAVRRLFVSAMTAFFEGWIASGKRIVPGLPHPANVVVPEPDFREGALIRSLGGWTYYDGPLSLVRPLLRNFYQQPAAQFPWCRKRLHPAFILDAAVEALGQQSATSFLQELRACLGDTPAPEDSRSWAEVIDQYLHCMQSGCYIPVALERAIARHARWTQANPSATQSAREEIVSELLRLYGLHSRPEWLRYHLYRHTYFAQATDATKAAFDVLLRRLSREPNRFAANLVELSDLQSTLDDPGDRLVFSRMVFPQSHPTQPIEVLSTGPEGRKAVIVQSQITDKHGIAYTVREPVEAAEVGKLYRLYVTAGYIKSMSPNDAFLVVLDDTGRVIGGLCYDEQEPGTVHLDGVVVSVSLRGRGISGALLEDFCARMTVQGIRVVKTHYFSRRFYTAHQFRVDEQWGGLVRFLSSEILGESAHSADSLFDTQS